MAKFEKKSDAEYVLAAEIHIPGKVESSGEGDDAKTGDINVIVVADMDVLSGVFFQLRERASFFNDQFAKWNLDNVTFVLNVLDDLADDASFIEIRKRRPQHRELTAIKRLEDEAKRNRNQARNSAEEKFKKTIEKEQDKIQKVAENLGIRDVYNMTPRQQQELEIATKDAGDRVEVKKAQLDRAEKDEYQRIENDMSANIQRVQDNYKLMAVLLPPVLPMVIAICVFFVRRSREKESVVASRLR